MDVIVDLYFNSDVKKLILSWVSFFKNNWNSLFNIDKEVILKLEFFLDNKKVVSKNAPPNKEIYLHEMKKNPEIVLKFMKVSLHLLLCKFLGLDKEIVKSETNTGTQNSGKTKKRKSKNNGNGGGTSVSGNGSGRGNCNDRERGNGKSNSNSKSNINNNNKSNRNNNSNRSCNSNRNGNSNRSCNSNRNGNSNDGVGRDAECCYFIGREEITDVENGNLLINELKYDRYRESEIFRNYFLTTRITIYLYNWNKINKFENLKSEKVNHLICLRGSVLRVSPIHLLITNLDFICAKCKFIIKLEFLDGKFETPKKCKNYNCDSRIFHPLRESAKSLEYQKIIIKENKKILNNIYETHDSNVKNLTVTLEVSKFFVNSCFPGNYIEALGILKVISFNNNYLINGKNSLFNMYIDCLSIFPLSSKKYLNNNYFNIEKIKQTKNKIYSSFLWESYIEKISKRVSCIRRGERCRGFAPGSVPTSGNGPTQVNVHSFVYSEHARLASVKGCVQNNRCASHNNVEEYGKYDDDNSSVIIVKEGRNNKPNGFCDISTVTNSLEINTYNALSYASTSVMNRERSDESEDVNSLYEISDMEQVHPYNNELLEGENKMNINGQMHHISNVNDDVSSDIMGNVRGSVSGHASGHACSSVKGDDRLSLHNMCMYGDYIDEDGLLNNPNHCLNLVRYRSEEEKEKQFNFNGTNKEHFNVDKMFDEKVLEFINDMQKYGSNKFYLLVASLCPRVIMNDYIKAGLLLSLLGGKTIYDECNQIKRRGNIHNLLIGDPGLGKSRILQYISNIIENSLFICSTSTSINGLTACAVKDPLNNEYSLEGGALVLSDKGICCIDELDKISLTDQQSFLECMESQCINITKAGIVCNLKTRCTIIAASNPKEGKYNYNKTIFDNIKIPFPLLSRFDLVFLLTDKISEEKDYLISNYLISPNSRKRMMRSFEPTGKRGNKGERNGNKQKWIEKEEINMQEDGENKDSNDNSPLFSVKDHLFYKCKQIDERNYLPVELLGVFIKYCRKCIFPNLSAEAKTYIRKFYLHLRNLSITNSDISAPITIRQLESLIRLCQARARADLSNVVTVEHAKEVVEIYQKTIFYPLHLKAMNFRKGTSTKMNRGKSAAALSNIFKENIINLVRMTENKIFNKDLCSMAKSVILSANSNISEDALIHFGNHS
ncbi:DNA helicase MCM8, putative (MCM8) [Plasmodium malariae]|uniref:DNA helicase n=1 Tax=Plasmodium malariae TaxID=5858 RepID=A0A1A8WDK6_PLAMA|nr:DNA helicase MCM8, putative (MCM8) [Plasmodium malariae]